LLGPKVLCTYGCKAACLMQSKSMIVGVLSREWNKKQLR